MLRPLSPFKAFLALFVGNGAIFHPLYRKIQVVGVPLPNVYAVPPEIDSGVGLIQSRSNDEILVGRKRSNFHDYVTPVVSAVAAMSAITSPIPR